MFEAYTSLESLLAIPIPDEDILKSSIFNLVFSPADIALSKTLSAIIFFKSTSEPEKSIASPFIL